MTSGDEVFNVKMNIQLASVVTSSGLLEKSINQEAKSIAKKLKLIDKIEHLARNPAFITLKDHKENYHTILLTHQKANLGK